MENNMDIDMEVCEPDSTVHIPDLDNQPPPPTQLELVRQRHQNHMRWCTDMLSSTMSMRAQYRQRLEDIKEHCTFVKKNLKIVSNARDRNFEAVKAAKVHLASVKEKCLDYGHSIEIESSWQPSVSMTDQELQELLDRVAKLRATVQLLRLSDEESPGSL